MDEDLLVNENLLSLLDFSMSSLIAGLVFGVIGIYVFKHGRKSADKRFVFVGLALMIYPYFTKGVLADWGIGIALCALGYYFKDH
jgi:hypothetical protein